MHIPPPHPPHHENAYSKRVYITFNNETLTTVDQLKTQTNPDTLELSLSLTHVMDTFKVHLAVSRTKEQNIALPADN